MGGPGCKTDKVLFAVFVRARITEKEYDHIASLVSDISSHSGPMPLSAANPHEISQAALYARLHLTGDVCFDDWLKDGATKKKKMKKK